MTVDMGGHSPEVTEATFYIFISRGSMTRCRTRGKTYLQSAGRVEGQGKVLNSGRGRKVYEKHQMEEKEQARVGVCEIVAARCH